jgi:transposase
MFFTFSESIWLYPIQIDFRKQIDGIVILVADYLNLNPASGQLFLFRNRTGNKLKILWWDKNGFWLFYKRLEKGKFKFPEISAETIELSREQMGWLLSGLDYTKHPIPPKIDPTNFY